MDPMEPFPEDAEIQAGLGAPPRAAPPRPQPPPSNNGPAAPQDSSSAHRWPRVVAALLLGMVAGLGLRGVEQHRHLIGKDAFLATQGQLWDQRYAMPHAGGIVIGVIGLAALLAVYEGLAALLKRFSR